jgi:NusA-like KH domain protein|tara:strand:- start:58 stop:474 length:417 start_codon:yes stop_codon:yes gene_type:complete
MAKTISMQDMRYLNLFGKITQISTRFCFFYNNSIIFCVPRSLISKAIGENARNIKKISEILGKRVKVIPTPNGIHDIKKFIENIVSPVTFKDLEVVENEIILTAGSQSKAALIGRNKRRLFELQKILHDYFGKEFKIV